jgi:hypothetical protein
MFRIQLAINALFFIGYSSACFFAVLLNQSVAHYLGYDWCFILLGFMTLGAIYVNKKVEYTYETFMPFISNDNTLKPDSYHPLYQNTNQSRDTDDEGPNRS